MNIQCGNCGAELAERETEGQPRSGCAICGSSIRIFHEEFTDIISVKEEIGTKHRRQGEKRPIFESKIGDSLHRDTGTWSHVEQVVDRENNIYRKLIVSADDQILRDEIKPLTDHTGHGSAKRKSPDE